MDKITALLPWARTTAPTEPTTSGAPPGAMGPPPRPLDREEYLRGGSARPFKRRRGNSKEPDEEESGKVPPLTESTLSQHAAGWDAGHISDDEDEDSNWDSYGDMPDLLDEYEQQIELVDGSADWNRRQRKVHQLIYMRGHYPIFPSWWQQHVKMWGIGLQHIFSPPRSKKRVLISGQRNDFAAAKALESLFTLTFSINDLEVVHNQEKMGSTAMKIISKYIKWAYRDAKFDKRFPPLFFVRSYPPDGFPRSTEVATQPRKKTNRPSGSQELEPSGSQELEPSETNEVDMAARPGGNGAPEPTEDVETITQSAEKTTKPSGSQGPESNETNTNDEILANEDETRLFGEWVDKDISTRMQDLGKQWRDLLEETFGDASPVEPPTIFGFAVVQHVVMLVSHDTSSPNNPTPVLDKVELKGKGGLWLWNALSIAIPVNVGRLQAIEIRTAFEGKLKNSSSSDDPDR